MTGQIKLITFDETNCKLNCKQKASHAFHQLFWHQAVTAEVFFVFPFFSFLSIEVVKISLVMSFQLHVSSSFHGRRKLEFLANK